MSKIIKIVVPLVFATIMMTVLGVFLNAKVASYLEGEQTVNHTYEVMVLAHEAQQSIDAADAEYLFYLVNGQDIHARYSNQLRAVGLSQLESLRVLTADNPNQSKTNVPNTIKAAQNRAAFTISVIDKKRRGEIVPEVGSIECVKLRRSIQDQFNAIDVEEKRLLDQRREINRANAVQLVTVLSCLAALMTAAYAFIVGIFYADIRRQDSMNHFMDQLKK